MGLHSVVVWMEEGQNMKGFELTEFNPCGTLGRQDFNYARQGQAPHSLRLAVKTSTETSISLHL